MKTGTYVPERGDIVKMAFSPQSGREQSGWRPAIVVSGKAYNDASGYALVCPITNTIKKYPFEVLLPKTAKTTGAILSDQVKSVDWKKRNATFIEKAPEKEIALVQAEIVALISE